MTQISFILVLCISCGRTHEVSGLDTGASETDTADPVSVAASDPAFIGPMDSLSFPVVLNELLVYSKASASESQIQKLAQQLGGSIVGKIPQIRMWQIRFPDPKGDPQKLQERLDNCLQEPIVVHCHPNEVLSPLEVYPDDGYSWEGTNDDCSCSEAWEDVDIKNQVWGQWAIKLPKAWDITTGSPNFPIAIIDEGVQVGHRDFEEAGVKMFGSSLKNNHGTHVAGILGARGNNGMDIAGVNWNAPLWFYEVDGFWGDDDWVGEFEGIPLSALQNAFVVAVEDDEVRLINYSYGRDWSDKWTGEKWCPADGSSAGGYSWEAWETGLENQKDAWRPVLDLLEEAGVLVVAAAGNNSDLMGKKCEVDAKWTGGPQSLADEYVDTVLLVASVGDPIDTGSLFESWSGAWSSLSPFSSTGDTVSVAAPGAQILSLCQFGSLDCPLAHTIYRSGTSMAAPFVTGLASLIWSIRPDMLPGEVIQRIIAGAVRGGETVAHPNAQDLPPEGLFVIDAWESLRTIEMPLECIDQDGDGWGIKSGDAGGVGLTCANSEADCDDSLPAVHPGAEETCNGIDDNCNGHVDEEGVCGEGICEEMEDGYSCGGSKVCFQGACCDPSSNCAGKECGSDGCGGTCGECTGGDPCVNGTCGECVPDCTGKECGASDGCGGQCECSSCEPWVFEPVDIAMWLGCSFLSSTDCKGTKYQYWIENYTIPADADCGPGWTVTWNDYFSHLMYGETAYCQVTITAKLSQSSSGIGFQNPSVEGTCFFPVCGYCSDEIHITLDNQEHL